MKKIVVILIAALTLAAPCAVAQDMFNHLALGVSAGLDGVGLEAATNVGSHLQLRAGYSIVPYTYSKTLNLGKVDLGGVATRSLENIPVTGKIWQGGVGNLLVDYFFGSGSFHVTAGVFAGSGNLLKVDADLRKALTADEYGTLGVGLGGSTISSDAQGYAHFDGKAMSVMPYVGLGLGRAIGDGRVKVTFDLGAAVDGGIKLQSYNYVRNTLSSTNPVETVQITSSTLSNKDKGWVDKIGKIPVFPMLKFGIYVRLF